MGFRYDGAAGWADNHVPNYRELTVALADIGVEPRRVRSWPNQGQIAALFAGARPAPEELLPPPGRTTRSRRCRRCSMSEPPASADLWLTWEAVRPALLAEPAVDDR